MIILPSASCETKLLMPVKKAEWNPSQTRPADQFGNKDTTLFRVRARLADGYIYWQGFFFDRDDFDVFIYSIISGTFNNDKFVWKLPNNEWTGEISEGITFDFATQTYLTSLPGSNQTYNRPSDWNNTNNSIEGIGGGGSGGARYGNVNIGNTGGGGGAYAKITNFSFTGTTATYQIGNRGAGRLQNVSGGGIGNPGTTTWFNSTTDPGGGTDNSKLGAAPGGAGQDGLVASSVAGGIGGAVASSWGQTRYAGGDGGNVTVPTLSRNLMTGGGGAGGNAGAGSQGGSITTLATPQSTAGGAGGSNNGGSGGTAQGGNGSAGSTWAAGFGAGGGGGGLYNGANGGNAGNYGAGGGASSGNSATTTSGNGSQGILVVTYEPLLALGFNMPNLGL